jgi:hypothetical protein
MWLCSKRPALLLWLLPTNSGGNVLLERLWIKGAQTMAVMYSRVTGHVVMSRVKITGVRPGGGFRFGVAGVGKGVSGRVTFEHNTIDHDEPWEGPGDDNGIAFAGANLAFVNITQNFIRAGEAVEIEGCSGLHSSYLVSRNTIVQTSVRSSLAASTVCLAFPHEQGGHPAAIKLVGNEALYNLVDENQVDTAVADASAVCILTGTNLNLASTTRVSKNTCTMNGQFGAFVGGWAGTPLFFPPFWVNDMFFVENVLNGSAKFGVSFMNFTYIVNGVPLESQTSVSRSHGNFIVNNDMSRFETSHADLFFDVSTSNNVAIGEFRGSIINLGEQNEIQN